MAQRFTLSYNDSDFQVDDPIGWEEGQHEITRKMEEGFDGVFQTFNIDLTWIQDGADLIQQAYELEGVEADIGVRIEVYNTTERKWEVSLEGAKISLVTYEIRTDKGMKEVTAPIEIDSFRTKFLQLGKKDVDALIEEAVNGNSITPVDVVETSLHPKTLFQKLDMELSEEVEGVFGLPVATHFVGSRDIGNGNSREQSVTTFWPIALNKINADSLKQHFNLGLGFVTDINNIPNIFTALFDSEVELDLSVAIEGRVVATRDTNNNNATVTCGSGLIGESFLKAILLIRDKDDNEKQSIEVCTSGNILGCNDTERDMEASGSLVQNLSLKAGDKVYLYAEMGQFGDYSRLLINNYNVTITEDFAVRNSGVLTTRFILDGTTTFEKTKASGILVHDLLSQVVKHLTGSDAFYSEYYGLTRHGYAQDGAGGSRVITFGYWLRGADITERKMFVSWQKLFESLEALDCVGLGFEFVDGAWRVRVEPKEHFYPDTVVLELEQVKNLTKKVATDRLFSTFKIGYQKYKGNREDGSILEFNTERQYFTGITQIDQEFKRFSGLVGAGYAIESTRRLQITSTEEDGVFDDDLFVIEVVEDFDPDQNTEFRSRSSQGVDSISGVRDSDGVYNIGLSPARSAIKWGKIIGDNLNWASDRLKFTSGEGNYNVVSTLTGEAQIDESGDLQDTRFGDILFIPEIFSFEAPLTITQVRELTANPIGRVQFRTNAGLIRFGHILNVEINEVQPGRSLAQFDLLRAK